MTAWIAFLCFAIGAFAVDWDKMPPFTSLVIAIIVVAWSFAFGHIFRTK